MWKPLSEPLTPWVAAPLPVYREMLLSQKMNPPITWQATRSLIPPLPNAALTSTYMWEYMRISHAKQRGMSARSRDKCICACLCVKPLSVLTVTNEDKEEQNSWDLKLIQHSNNGLSWREVFDSLWLRQEAENNTLTCFIKLVNAVSTHVSPPRSHRLHARLSCTGMSLKEDLINHWMAWENDLKGWIKLKIHHLLEASYDAFLNLYNKSEWRLGLSDYQQQVTY